MKLTAVYATLLATSALAMAQSALPEYDARDTFADEYDEEFARSSEITDLEYQSLAAREPFLNFLISGIGAAVVPLLYAQGIRYLFAQTFTGLGVRSHHDQREVVSTIASAGTTQNRLSTRVELLLSIGRDTTEESQTCEHVVKASGAASLTDRIQIMPIPSSKWAEDIEDLHTGIAVQMDREFYRCSVDSFFKTYMPFSPTGDDVLHVMATSKGLKGGVGGGTIDTTISQKANFSVKGAHPASDTGGIRKTELFEADDDAGLPESNMNEEWCSAGQNHAEGSILHHLQGAADAASNTSVANRSRNGLTFQCCPDTLLASDYHGSGNRIDACISSDTVRHGGDLQAQDVAVVFEVATSNDPVVVIRNSQQAVSANVQIMGSDARRAFSFGVNHRFGMLGIHSLTSRAANRLRSCEIKSGWYTMGERDSRSAQRYHPADSDFLQRNRRERKAGPELGGRLNSDNRDRYYRTSKLLTTCSRKDIKGRTSRRVWLVDILDSPTDTESRGQAVLKDMWTNEGSSTERDIQEQIFRDIYDYWHSPQVEQTELYKSLAFLGPELRDLAIGPFESAAFRDYFLHIESDWSGDASPKLPEDAVPVKYFLLPTPQEATDVEKDTYIEQSRENHAEEIQRTTRIEIVNDRPTHSFVPMRPYRVVYKEVCTSIDFMDTLGDVVDTLRQALFPLRLMFSVGWVHRDISAGNIMAEVVEGRLHAKLCDLEYARKLSSYNDIESSNEGPVGTPYFMAHEILSGHSLHPTGSRPLDPTQEPEPEPRTREESIAQIRAKFLERSRQKPEAVGRPYRSWFSIPYNFQHDIESFFWLALWNVTIRSDYGPARHYGRQFFRNGTRDTKSSWNALAAPVHSTLLRVLAPAVRKPFAFFFEEFRQKLVDEDFRRRTRFYDAYVVDPKEYASIHLEADLAFTLLKVDPDTGWRSAPLRVDR
ncbi:hypothetical protein NMY22_g5116 [Coprinellus aureogranulatus]|nr:hypothetical protein NMY22_g5116 [Coprinellus aureogranulatus]